MYYTTPIQKSCKAVLNIYENRMQSFVHGLFLLTTSPYRGGPFHTNVTCLLVESSKLVLFEY